MESEHQESGDDLETLRQLTNSYAPPEDACGAFRAMLAGFERLDNDLREHIHKENNILFPRAIEAEQRAAG